MSFRLVRLSITLASYATLGLLRRCFFYAPLVCYAPLGSLRLPWFATLPLVCRAPPRSAAPILVCCATLSLLRHTELRPPWPATPPLACYARLGPLRPPWLATPTVVRYALFRLPRPLRSLRAPRVAMTPLVRPPDWMGDYQIERQVDWNLKPRLKNEKQAWHKMCGIV